MVLMTLILPPIFYLSIRTQEVIWLEGNEKSDEAEPIHERATLKE